MPIKNLILCGVAALAIAACDNSADYADLDTDMPEESTANDENTDTTADNTMEEEPTTTSSGTEALDDVETVAGTIPAAPPTDMYVSRDGFGNVRIDGTTENTNLYFQNGSEGECVYGTQTPSDERLYFMSVDGKIARIDIREGDISLENGLGIGSSSADIETAYPDLIETRPDKYDPDGTEYIIRYGDDRGIVFDVADDAVTSYRVGRFPEVAWVEGCS